MMTITGRVKSNQPNKWPHQQTSIWLSQMLFQILSTAKDLEELTTWIQDSRFFSFSGKCNSAYCRLRIPTPHPWVHPYQTHIMWAL